jgi:hypothetical protein
MNFPDEKISVIVLGNAGDFNSYGSAVDVAKLVLKDKFREAEQVKDKTKDAPVAKLNPAVAQKCTGMFQLGAGWYVTITLENNSLMTQANGEEKFPMSPRSDSVYWVDAYGASMTFVPDSKGEVKSLRYRWIREAKRITPIKIDETLFNRYTGTYYSEELASEYKVEVKNGKLWMHHMRLGEFELHPDPVKEDQFSGSIGSIQFVGGAQNKITGFKLSGGRIRNIQFDRR